MNAWPQSVPPSMLKIVIQSSTWFRIMGFDDVLTFTSQMLPSDIAVLPIWLTQLPPITWSNSYAVTKALWTHLKSPDPELTFANMMEGFDNLVNSKSASHAMRLYARKCLDYHQAYERRFKNAWLDLVDAVTASTLFSSTSSLLVSSRTDRQLQHHREHNSAWRNGPGQSQSYLLGRLVGTTDRTSSTELEIWSGQEVTMGLGRRCDFLVDDRVLSSNTFIQDMSCTGTYFGKHLIGKGQNVILLDGIQISLSQDLGKSVSMKLYRYVQQHPITPHNQPLYPSTLVGLLLLCDVTFQQIFNWYKQGTSYLVSERPLGYGAQSKILLACHYDKKTLQYACKKTILKSKFTSKQALKELNILNRLHHYSVVKTITSLWEPGDRCLIIMPIYDGGTLQDWVNKRPALDIFETRFITHQICHAVDPENILLAKDTRYPRVVITDFGLAVDLQVDSPAHGNYGTPGYSAPEVLSGSLEYSYPVDCWSMGALFYFIWTGRHAFMLPDILPHQLLEIVLKGDYNQTSPEWRNIDDGGLLTVDSNRRLTTSQCSQDPWLMQDEILYKRLYFLMNNEA
ncbi:hypothetical protein NQZ79_g531 [Umbelopsis isabellina]|nr:hypothetical protein NQZ79_g531 [Umbelopsis isabellina]